MERHNPNRSTYLTVQELTQSQRREQLQSSISSRLNQNHQIIVNRKIVEQASPQAHSNFSGGIQITPGNSQVNQNVVNRLKSSNNPGLSNGVKNVIREAYSDIDFNNFDIAYNKVSQAIKMLENGA